MRIAILGGASLSLRRRHGGGGRGASTAATGGRPLTACHSLGRCREIGSQPTKSPRCAISAVWGCGGAFWAGRLLTAILSAVVLEPRGRRKRVCQQGASPQFKRRLRSRVKGGVSQL